MVFHSLALLDISEHPVPLQGLWGSLEEGPVGEYEKSWQGSGGHKQPVTVVDQRGKGRSPVGVSRCPPSMVQKWHD